MIDVLEALRAAKQTDSHAKPLLHRLSAHDMQTIQKAVERYFWVGGHTLQVDSYATGHPQSHTYVQGRKAHIALTDGHSSWSAEIPVPKEYAK